MWIRIRMDPHWFWAAVSGSRRAKITLKIKKVNISCFASLDVLCWVSPLTWTSFIVHFFLAVNFSIFIIKTLDPDPNWSRMLAEDPHWSRCWIRIRIGKNCGSTTPLVSYYTRWSLVIRSFHGSNVVSVIICANGSGSFQRQVKNSKKTFGFYCFVISSCLFIFAWYKCTFKK